MSHEHSQVSIDVELDAFFGQYTAANQARGLVYGLVGPAGLVHSAGFGVANDAGQAPDLDTVFPIASMSKSFVACAALLARDRGLISLDAPISDFFDGFTANLVDGEPCRTPTIRMLLSMGSGLTEDNAWVDPFIDVPIAELLSTVSRGLAYSRAPGISFDYSNLGFALAGLAVGRAVGQPIEQWISTEIFQPLHLASTRFDNDGSARADEEARATGYRLGPTGEWVGFPPATSAAFAAAGGIQSTVRDLATWVTWLSSAFRPIGRNDDEPVSRQSRREMQHLHQLDLPTLATRPDGTLKLRVAGYGLGLVISEDLHRGTVVMHSGGLPGFILNMTWHPDSGHGIVVLTNSHRGNPVAMSEEALYRLMDRHRTPARTIRPWPATVNLQHQTEVLVRRWDTALAEQIFAPNIAFDRPLSERQAEIELLIDQVGPLREHNGMGNKSTDIVSATSPADITWAIPAERGELLCMIHLTPTTPPQIQEFEVKATLYGTPRSARRTDISPRRARLGDVPLSSLPNTRIDWPES
ncbi:MAG: serine hydrolase domain-containing protein [Nakamurella sp.]